jgi:hypothetical protein
MSNSLAIATVTGALAARVQALLNGAGLTGFQVVAGHPRNTPASGVYITLYHLSANGALRNFDLPTRRADASTSQRPMLALTLRYLFSFVGATDQFDAERLAGLVLADLHARPVIGVEEITGFLGTLGGTHPLRASDLAGQPERVKLSPINLDPEEMSRVWGLFNQNLFALSMAWEAAAVLLDGRVEPSLGLPVATPQVAVRPVVPPVVTRLSEEVSRQPVIESTQTLVLEGSGLLNERTHVVIGDARVLVNHTNVRDGALRVPLGPVAGLRPGVQPVVIEHSIAIPGAAGDGFRPLVTSNPVAVMVRPVLGTASSAPGDGVTRLVTIPVTPQPAPDQTAELRLEAVGDGARRSSRSFEIAAGNMVFTVATLPTGVWAIRLVIDGAANLPPLVGGVYTGPTLTVP